MKIKVGLIGVSGYGHVHFLNWSRLVREGGAELAAAVIINPDQVPEQLAVLREFGTRIYSSADAMFEGEKGETGLGQHSDRDRVSRTDDSSRARGRRRRAG